MTLPQEKPNLVVPFFLEPDEEEHRRLENVRFPGFVTAVRCAPSDTVACFDVTLLRASSLASDREIPLSEVLAVGRCMIQCLFAFANPAEDLVVVVRSRSSKPFALHCEFYCQDDRPVESAKGSCTLPPTQA